MSTLQDLTPSELVESFVSASLDFERWSNDFRRGNAASAKAQSVFDELERRGATENLLPLLQHGEMVVRGLAAIHLMREFPDPASRVLLAVAAEPGLLALKFKLSCHKFGLIGDFAEPVEHRVTESVEHGVTESVEHKEMNRVDPTLDDQVMRFLVEVHRLIDEVARRHSPAILERIEPVPPNERDAALHSELTEFGRAVMFHVLGLMDGVGDPELTREPWDGLMLERRLEDSPMLHDAFMEAQARYEALRGDGR